MIDEVKNWGKGLPDALVIVSRLFTAAGNAAAELLELMRPPGHPVLVPDCGLERWLAMYRDPQQFRDGLIEVIWPTDENEQPFREILVPIIRAVARLRAKDAPAVAQWIQDNPEEAAAVVRDTQKFMRSMNRAQMRELEREWLGIGDQQRDSNVEQAIRTPEMKFLLRVWMPCVVLHRQKPSALFRLARFGDVEALRKLLQIDKAVMFEPRIAQAIWQASVCDWPRYNMLATAIKSPPPKLSRKRVKHRFLALASIIHTHRGGIDSPRLKELADAIMAAESKGKTKIDMDLGGQPEALTRQLHRERQAWQKLLQPHPDKIKS